MAKLGVLQGGYNTEPQEGDLGYKAQQYLKDPNLDPARRAQLEQRVSNLKDQGRYGMDASMRNRDNFQPLSRPMPGQGGVPGMPRPQPQGQGFPQPLQAGNPGQNGQFVPLPRPMPMAQGIGANLGAIPMQGFKPVNPGAGAMNPQMQSQALGQAFADVAGGVPTKPMPQGGIQPNKPYYR